MPLERYSALICIVLIGLYELSVSEGRCYYRWQNNVLVDARGEDGNAVVHFDNGSTISLGDDSSVKRLANCLSPDEARDAHTPTKRHRYGYYSGWVEFAGYLAVQNITQFIARWQVPAAPPRYNIFTTTFLFAGLEQGAHGTGNTDILQPVLQYGHSGCGGGDHWSVASFFVSGITAHCGKVLRVEEGDEILANMTYKTEEDTWIVSSVVRSKSGVSQESVLRVKAMHAYKWASLTLEGIRVYHCTAYPSGNVTIFTDAQVKVLGESVSRPPWKPEVSYHDCGQSVEIMDERTVGLHYNSTASKP